MNYFITRCVYRGAAECLPRAAVTETNAGSSLRHERRLATAGSLQKDLLIALKMNARRLAICKMNLVDHAVLRLSEYVNGSQLEQHEALDN